MTDQPLSPGGNKEEKEVKRANSFTNFLRSPSRANSMKRGSSKSLSKILFGRKSSKRGDDDESESNRDEPVDNGATEEETTLSNLLEEVKEVVGTAVDDVTHPEKKDTTTTAEQTTTTDAPRSIDPSSEAKQTTYDVVDRVQEGLDYVASEAKETKHALFGKFKEGLGKAKEGLKDEYGKAKAEVKSILHKDDCKSSSQDEQHYQQQQPLVEKKPSVVVVDTSTEKKPLVYEDVKAPNIAQRIQEEVVAVVSTIEAAKKKGETCQEESKGEREVKKEESREQGEIKKEDNCISSLAQGLERLCLPWASKKED